ncbi:MAG: hypothetical protein ACOX5A_00305 [Aminivibrio sp.]|nr:hypothetical protein [Synergistaceae bacterium]
MKEAVNTLFRKVLYFSAILVIAVGAVNAYFLWWELRESQNPDLVAAVSYTHADRIPARAILFWREEKVLSKWAGTVSYPSIFPGRVARGDTVAVVDGPAGKMAVKAERAGYFLPALDGAEGDWTYSALWGGMDPLPKAPKAEFFAPGTRVEKGSPVGKLAPQPQELRCILYADAAPSLARDIRKGFVRVKTRADEWPLRAEVRAARFRESKVKLYLTLPFFPSELISSRELSLILEAGEKTGVAVPESAVTIRGGKLGVLMVDDGVHFKEVKGAPADEGRFFITEGLRPGQIVVLNAQSGKEGKIRLW